jgi:hypothetical protein
MNLCTMKNMIQLSNLDFLHASSMFTRKDRRDSNFQETIMKVICLVESFQVLIKAKYGLNKDEKIPEKLFPSTFKEETVMLYNEGMLKLRRTCVGFYW